MEEDVETRKINSSFLRDHSYATEGECRGRQQQVGAAPRQHPCLPLPPPAPLASPASPPGLPRRGSGSGSGPGTAPSPPEERAGGAGSIPPGGLRAVPGRAVPSVNPFR